MKLEVVLSLFLLAATNLLGALPLDLQWRAQVPQSAEEKTEVSYGVRDNENNIIFSGRRGNDATGYNGVVIKLDASGEKLWDVVVPDSAEFYISGLGTDEVGNIYFTTALTGGTTGRPIVLIKLNPAGQELWRCPMDGTIDLNGIHPFRISADGTVWVEFFKDIAPANQEISVVCISSAGDILWTNKYAAFYDNLVSYDRSRQLTVDEDKASYVVAPKGGYPPLQGCFVVKIDAAGQTLWTNEVSSAYHLASVRGLPAGPVCVAGIGGYAVFDSSGHAVKQGGFASDTYLLDDAVAGQGFLMTHVNRDFLSLLFVDLQGNIKWEAPFDLEIPYSIIRNPAGGWLVGGYNRTLPVYASPTQMYVQALAEDGSRRWRQEMTGVSDYIFSGFGAPNLVLLKPSDGQLRLLAQQHENTQALSVVAASFTLPETSPDSLFLTAPAHSMWMAGQTHTLSAMPQGEGPFSYQWYYMGKILPAETDLTLSLPPAQFPAARGYYYLEISDGNQTTTSPMASVALGGIFLRPQGFNEYGALNIRAYADVGVRFVLQTSPDMATWSQADFRTNSFSADIPISIGGNTAIFIRAQEVK